MGLELALCFLFLRLCSPAASTASVSPVVVPFGVPYTFSIQLLDESNAVLTDECSVGANYYPQATQVLAVFDETSSKYSVTLTLSQLEGTIEIYVDSEILTTATVITAPAFDSLAHFSLDWARAEPYASEEAAAILGAQLVFGLPDVQTLHAFLRGASGWAFAGSVLPEDGHGERFGSAVLITETHLLVGAPGDSENGADAGAVYAYPAKGDIWGVEAKLFPGSPQEGAAFGAALQAASGSLFVAAPQRTVGGEAGAGAVFAFALYEGAWAQRQELTAATASSGAAFGSQLAASGSVLAVASAAELTIFELGADGAWVAEHTRAGDYSQAALATNGSVVCAGFSTNGTVQVFARPETSWALQFAYSGEADAQFGATVALDGDLLAVGAPAAAHGGANAGSVYVFAPALYSDSWRLLSRIDGAAGDELGTRLFFANGTVYTKGTRDSRGVVSVSCKLSAAAARGIAHPVTDGSASDTIELELFDASLQAVAPHPALNVTFDGSAYSEMVYDSGLARYVLSTTIPRDLLVNPMLPLLRGAAVEGFVVGAAAVPTSFVFGDVGSLVVTPSEVTVGEATRFNISIKDSSSAQVIDTQPLLVNWCGMPALPAYVSVLGIYNVTVPGLPSARKAYLCVDAPFSASGASFQIDISNSYGDNITVSPHPSGSVHGGNTVTFTFVLLNAHGQVVRDEQPLSVAAAEGEYKAAAFDTGSASYTAALRLPLFFKGTLYARVGESVTELPVTTTMNTLLVVLTLAVAALFLLLLGCFLFFLFFTRRFKAKSERDLAQVLFSMKKRFQESSLLDIREDDGPIDGDEFSGAMQQNGAENEDMFFPPGSAGYTQTPGYVERSSSQGELQFTY